MTGRRYCLLCQEPKDVAVCPTHNVDTVSLEMFDPNATLEPSSIVAGKYRIERPLGRGGFGSVFEAVELGLDRKVALKVLRGDLGASKDNLARFFREARLLSQLAHPNVVQVYAFGVDERTRQPWLAMELVRGSTLRALIEQDGPLPEKEAARISARVARALVAIHDRQLIHRDLKADNVILQDLPHGERDVKVADFGVARQASGGDPSLTGHRGGLGTPTYMSPEQVMGGVLDFRSDLYSLGCLIHYLLTGDPPFAPPERGDAVQAVLHMQVNDAPPPLPSELVDGAPPSRPLIDLRDRLLAKKAGDRPATTLVCLEVLEALAGDDVSAARARIATMTSAPKASRRPWSSLIAAGIAATVAIVWIARPMPEPARTADPPPAMAPPPEVEVEVPQKETPVRTVKIRVTSSPASVEVFIDGKSRGRAPLTLTLPAQVEGVRLRASLPGYVEQSRVIPLDRDREIQLHMLRPM